MRTTEPVPSPHAGPAARTAARFRPLIDEADFERFIGEFTNYERMKEYRYAGDTLSLARMESLLEELGRPERSIPAVHIAGTKGKGTTTLILEALLTASGFRVGSYTSPHVESLRERIRASCEPIPARALSALASSVLPVLEARWAAGPEAFPTFFELMTALSMLHFRDLELDWAVFEVGLGGRLDATNVLRPRLSAITSIGLEHTDKLGDTLALIAYEKAGIVKPGVPVWIGRLPPEAHAVVRSTAASRGAPLAEADPGLVRAAGPGRLEVGGAGWPWSSGPIPAGAVRGPALRADLALALELWRTLLAGEGGVVRREELTAALEALRLPARAEVLPVEPPVVIDGAHTRESAAALRETLRETGFPEPRTLVIALALDKPLDPILAELKGTAASVIATRADSARGREPEEIAERCRALGLGPAEAVEEPEEAFERARARGAATVVTGSFYLAGRLRPLALGKRG